MKLKRPFVAVGIAATTVGLGLGLGVSAATASTGSSAGTRIAADDGLDGVHIDHAPLFQHGLGR